jgi:Uncharacterized protein conserved in bacteria
MQKKTKVTVEILGDTYPIKGDVEEERIVRLAAFLDDRMRRIYLANPRLSATKVAVLAALNLADEYMRLDQDYRQLVKLMKDGK